MEVKGKVIQILPIQEGTAKATGNPWKSQSFIIETQEQYPRKICCEIFGEDRINANPVQMDEMVTVSFDIDSREYNGRWYTSIRAYRVVKDGASTTPPIAQAPVQPQAQPAPMSSDTAPFDAVASSGDEESDLPF
ncbi:MAG: DUF3127 domain-containing protein [Paludibacteraceae bacterium]|nr:DUF3127 domain-containing protein [Paludibacteraceae bacterium]